MYIGSFKASRLTLKGSQKSECTITLGSVAVGIEGKAAEARAAAAAGVVTAGEAGAAGEVSTAAMRAGCVGKLGSRETCGWFGDSRSMCRSSRDGPALQASIGRYFWRLRF